ncbi:dimethyladenosine transferase [Thermodesulfatator indicus DSM 15286]|uniref:Ribosomal RNA small subunit methyltransferase A n=1 Tax=Thermodesulfatator indicus (strain DSM 15286 / JCM 11887 / CIR29812) TaxID=667014 RepID=F8ADU3_THEID|nr:16S rRNA (adenine(1518)-N(6)/adenine(1519)-N(6))-dimethyltransferase RsmA [Thermodesulfatator indicus]AEH46054.1 dimethyladenosine transferase [Thermodesulfatator indicus DSM 15286]
MPEPTLKNSPSKIPLARELLRRYELKAKKSLGQNFLADPKIAEKIVSLSELPSGKTVVELGVGLGTLTYALAKVAKRVIGFELDQNLIEILEKERFLPPNVEIRHGDILKLDYQALAEEIGEKLIIFGNLPYYLSSRLLWNLIQERKDIDFCVFMFQKEVAERLMARPGTKDYGPLSVLLALTAKVKKLMELSPGCFYPPPEVRSSLIKIKFINNSLPNEKELLKVLKASFASRRKKLVTNLKALGLSKEEARNLLEEINVSSNARAEELSPEKFLALAEKLSRDE